MICVDLESPRLVLGQPNGLTIRLTNTGRVPCTNLVFKLTLPTQIALLQGPDRIEIARLDAGKSIAHTVQVRPKQVGAWTLTSANFSYRDANGQSRRITDLRLVVEVVSAAPAPAPPEAKLAEAHESAGEWHLAWPLFRRAGLTERARTCFHHALDLYERERQDREAAQQYEAWADLEIELAGRRALGDRTIAEWLERAADHYMLAGDTESAARCREKAAQLMQVARFRLQVTASPDARFTEGKSTLITVRLTNTGYGPAREVRVRVSGDVEAAQERVFTELQVGQQVEWNTARVVPTRAGTCLLRVDVDYRSYRSEQVSHADIEQPILVDEGGLFPGIRRAVQSGASLQLNIEKYLAPGATSNEMDVHDSVVIARAPLFTEGRVESSNRTETANIIKDSVFIDRSAPSAITERSPASGVKSEGFCPRCGKPRATGVSRCANCGNRLCKQCGNLMSEEAHVCGFCGAGQ